MLKEIFTFNELKSEYGWDSRPHAIKNQITYARKRGVFIEPVLNSNKPQQFKLIENHPYNIKELINRYNWMDYILKAGIERQIIYAKSRGVELEPIQINGQNYFNIIKEENCLQEEWYPCAEYEKYWEITKSGALRRVDNKILLGSLNYAGYKKVNSPIDINKTVFIHRLVLQTFKPIDNPEDYVVDHINGIRDDNRVENLRWVTRRENNQFKDDNWANIGSLTQQLIEKIGYEKTYNEIKAIFDKLE